MRQFSPIRAFLSMMARLMIQLLPIPTLGIPAASFRSRSSGVS